MDLDNSLHRARLTRGISLSELAARTFLSPRILQKIDCGQFEELPGGVYARSYVRAFASAVGLDPEQAVQELQERLPPAEDPLPAMRDIARANTPGWVVLFAELSGSVTTWISTSKRPRTTCQRWLRLSAARWAGVCVDGAGLVLLYALLVRLTYWVSGDGGQVDPQRLHAAVALLWAVIALTYFVLFGGIAGRTPGASLCGVPADPVAAPLRLRSIILRAMPLASSDVRTNRTGAWHTESAQFDAVDSTV